MSKDVYLCSHPLVVPASLAASRDAGHHDAEDEDEEDAADVLEVELVGSAVFLNLLQV